MQNFRNPFFSNAPVGQIFANSALRLKPQFHDLHIAAVTGWGQDEDRRKAREAGCDSHFTKPLSPAALGEVLAKIANTPPLVQPSGSTPRTRHADLGGSHRVAPSPDVDAQR